MITIAKIVQSMAHELYFCAYTYTMSTQQYIQK